MQLKRMVKEHGFKLVADWVMGHFCCEEKVLNLGPQNVLS